MTEKEKLKGTVEFECNGETLTFCYTWDGLRAVSRSFARSTQILIILG